MSDEIDVQIRRKNQWQKSSPLEFLVDGNLEDQQRFVVICQYVQAKRLERVADALDDLARRNAETMTTLVSAMQDFTKEVKLLRSDLRQLSNDGIAARMEREIDRVAHVAMETIGGIKG